MKKKYLCMMMAAVVIGIGGVNFFSKARAVQKFQLTSKAFQEGNEIPVMFTCDGEDYSPELHWHNAPKGTKSFALVCKDPDAPQGTFIHWLIYNIPPTVDSLEKGVSPEERQLDNGALQGRSSFKRLGYAGPCPPLGDDPHRYQFILYALDSMLQLESGASYQMFEVAAQGHILAQAELVGLYQRT